jgi:NAD-dependent oxidoreductase involved in siderophore biosynthesis
MRTGTVKTVWNNSVAGYTDYSTRDIVASTLGINFTVDVSGSNVRLNAVITSGTWEVRSSAEIIF